MDRQNQISFFFALKNHENQKFLIPFFYINIFPMVKEELFSWTNPDDALDLEAVEATVMALLNIVMTVQDTDPAQNRESRDLPQQDEVLQEESIGDQNSQTNYPDLVPRTETRFEAERKLSLRENFVKSQVHQIEQQSATAASQLTDFEFTDYQSVSSEQFFEIIENQEVQSGPISETLFLLAILFGTCILLYFFPPGP